MIYIILYTHKIVWSTLSIAFYMHPSFSVPPEKTILVFWVTHTKTQYLKKAKLNFLIQVTFRQEDWFTLHQGYLCIVDLRDRCLVSQPFSKSCILQSQNYLLLFDSLQKPLKETTIPDQNRPRKLRDNSILPKTFELPGQRLTTSLLSGKK